MRPYQNERHLRFQICTEKYEQNLKSQIVTSNQKVTPCMIENAITSKQFGGEKWFAFSKFDKEALALLDKLAGVISE